MFKLVSTPSCCVLLAPVLSVPCIVVLNAYPSSGSYTLDSKRLSLFSSLLCGGTMSVFDLQRGQFPGMMPPSTRVVITGSPAGVYESAAWIQDMLRFLRSLLSQGHCRIVGICFGAQALAAASGGTVEKGMYKESGVRGSLKYAHGDWITRVGSCASRVLENSLGIDFFALGQTAIGFQAHVEAKDEGPMDTLKRVSRRAPRRAPAGFRFTRETSLRVHPSPAPAQAFVRAFLDL